MSKCGCGRKTGKYGKVILNYNGYKLKITKLGSECEKCAIKEFLRKFSLYSGIIKKKEGIVIDWDYYCGAHNEIKPTLNEILVALNILTYSSNGNWEVVGATGMKLDPIDSDGCLYFTRRKDILEFINCNYRRMTWPCEIRRISGVKEYLPEYLMSEYLIVKSGLLR